MKKNKKSYILTGSEGSVGKTISKHYKSKKINILGLDAISQGKSFSFQKSMKINLTSEVQVKHFFDGLEKRKIYPEVLINCAGYFNNFPIISYDKGKLKAHSFKNFDKIIKSNLYTAFLMSVHYANLIISNKKKGLIINFSSVSSNSNIGQIAYSIAKSSIETLNKSIVKEVGAYGVRSVCISPGFFDTNSTSKILKNKKIKEIIKNIPVKRLGNEKEILNSLDYIIKNEYLNGCTLNLDGGINI